MTVSLRGHNDSNYGQQSSKKYVFKREQKTGSDGADVMCCGRLFQILCVSAHDQPNQPMAVLTITLVCVAAAGLLVVIQ